ncbi:MAG: methylated-DNA--[protein]-cysteine S-methyltransferase [Streptosporangiales bacterium]|nr:methylated-DNA--[protein]-cysteine S-methyltransferase [Streptosporangiales bacterium]
MATRHTRIDTELGRLTLVADGGRLTGLYFPHHRRKTAGGSRHWYRPLDEAFGSFVDAETDPLFAEVAAELGDYLAGRRTSFDVPTAAAGDAFQQRVWALLDEIPYGTTTTYGDLAERLGDRSLARDVGQAVGRNPLCVIVPCHRVVGKGGTLTGYAGGLRRKSFLLALEDEAAAKVIR